MAVDHSKVLVTAPIGRDAALAVEVLQHAGVSSEVCPGLAELAERVEDADCLVMTEESLHSPAYAELRRAIAAQAAWSDIPIILITFPGSNSATVKQALDELGNVSLVERPLSASVLASLVRSALLSRQKQYQVRDHIDRLNEASAQLQAASDAKDELLALISHELRTPLVSILGLSEVLVRRPQLEAQVRSEAQEQVLSEAHRLHRIVDNMLVLAHAETAIDSAAEPILLHRTMARIVSRLERIPRKCPIEFRVESDIPPVLGHETYLDQVVSNLVHNAEKYGTPGTPIAIQVRKAGDRADVSVHNSGPVLAKASIERLFQAFERGEQAEGPLPGLGLGLAVCKRLMDAQHGEIVAYAPETGGLEVHLHFNTVD